MRRGRWSVALVLGALLLTGCMTSPGGRRVPASGSDGDPGPDFARKPGAVARLPADPPFPSNYAWPEEFEVVQRRPSLGISAGVALFDGGLHLDTAPFVAPRLVVPLRGNLDLELPIKIAFATAHVTTTKIITIPPMNNQPPQTQQVRSTESKDGEVVCAELGVILRSVEKSMVGPFEVSHRFGVGLGATCFTGFGSGNDDTCLSAHVSAALEFARSDRFRLVLDGQAHGAYTDFLQSGHRSLMMMFIVGLGAEWNF